MKTETTREADPTAATHTPDAPRREPVGPSFPDVLGARGAMTDEVPGVVEEGGEGATPDGFVPLAAALATQAVVASQALVARRGAVDPSAPSPRPRLDPLDSATRQVAHLAPPGAAGPPEATARLPDDAPVEARTHASLEEVLPAIVRRIAWAGDGRRGSLRLEFGAGALAGGTLIVHADDGRVKVELRAPSGADAIAWRDRIAARLEEKSLQVDEIVVE